MMSLPWMMHLCRQHRLSSGEITERLDQNDKSSGRCGVVPDIKGSKSEVNSSADWFLPSNHSCEDIQQTYRDEVSFEADVKVRFMGSPLCKETAYCMSVMCW